MTAPSERDKSLYPEAMSGEFKPATTRLRCPKCRSADLSLSEAIEASTTFHVISGRLNRAAGYHEFGGFIGRLLAECSRCNHHWHPRRAIQITDVCEDVEQ